MSRNGAAWEPDARQIEALLGGGMRCLACDGTGAITEVVRVAPGLWIVTWLTGHAWNCSGDAFAESAYLVDMDALLDGDTDLPGVMADWWERRP